METLANLTALIADFAIVDPASINLTDTLGDLGLDSLDLLQLGLEVEEEFEIELPEGTGLERATTVAQIHDLIETLQAA